MCVVTPTSRNCRWCHQRHLAHSTCSRNVSWLTWEFGNVFASLPWGVFLVLVISLWRLPFCVRFGVPTMSQLLYVHGFHCCVFVVSLREYEILGSKGFNSGWILNCLASFMKKTPKNYGCLVLSQPHWLGFSEGEAGVLVLSCGSWDIETDPEEAARVESHCFRDHSPYISSTWHRLWHMLDAQLMFVELKIPIIQNQHISKVSRRRSVALLRVPLVTEMSSQERSRWHSTYLRQSKYFSPHGLRSHFLISCLQWPWGRSGPFRLALASHHFLCTV